MELLLHVLLIIVGLGVVVLLLYTMVNGFRLAVWLVKWGMLIQLKVLVVCLPLFALSTTLERELGFDTNFSERVFPVLLLAASILAGMVTYSNQQKKRRDERERKDA
ncbi:hypothetical protein RSK20926_05462 [Roseobacter sp. SK209-2-6]|uniref:hypothetical protein n=1 Tax=Roseobacter sp. SK209-2-6 TaxID=388739 RepID=UPI0000F3CD07|nr:hypothetical protein [Roseobacter sp. SK209-2-6]EBA16034.1 hypothetical protein RSK20926_05462 [Roseobacter sp. SK209-2-6]